MCFLIASSNGTNLNLPFDLLSELKSISIWYKRELCIAVQWMNMLTCTAQRETDWIPRIHFTFLCFPIWLSLFCSQYSPIRVKIRVFNFPIRSLKFLWWNNHSTGSYEQRRKWNGERNFQYFLWNFPDHFPFILSTHSISLSPFSEQWEIVSCVWLFH